MHYFGARETEMKRFLCAIFVWMLSCNVSSAEKAGGTAPHCRVNKKTFVNIYADVDGEVVNQKGGTKDYDLWAMEYKRDKRGRLMAFTTGERQNNGWMYVSDLECK